MDFQDLAQQLGVDSMSTNVDWNSLARSMIRKIDVETAYGPSMSLNDPFAPGPPNPYLQQLRPKVTMHLKHGQKPVVVAPYGDPPPTKWPLIEKALLAGSFIAVTGAVWWLGRKLL